MSTPHIIDISIHRHNTSPSRLISFWSEKVAECVGSSGYRLESGSLKVTAQYSTVGALTSDTHTRWRQRVDNREQGMPMGAPLGCNTLWVQVLQNCETARRLSTIKEVSSTHLSVADHKRSARVLSMTSKYRKCTFTQSQLRISTRRMRSTVRVTQLVYRFKNSLR